jgi:hypothetical protein
MVARESELVAGSSGTGRWVYEAHTQLFVQLASGELSEIPARSHVYARSGVYVLLETPFTRLPIVNAAGERPGGPDVTQPRRPRRPPGAGGDKDREKAGDNEHA